MGGLVSSNKFTKLMPKFNPLKSFQKIAGKEMNKEFSNRLQKNITGKSAANTTANSTGATAAPTNSTGATAEPAKFAVNNKNNSARGGSRKKNKKYKKSRT